MLLDAEEGHAGRPHGGLHVDPGGVGPLGQRVGTLVEDLVEDLQTLVGQADLVGVGVDQEPGHPPGPVLGVHGPLLAADVAGGLGDAGQQALDPRPEGLHPPQPYDAGGAQPPGTDVAVVVVAPAAPGLVVVVVVGVPSGALEGGAFWLGGLAGVGVFTVALTGLAAR